MWINNAFLKNEENRKPVIQMAPFFSPELLCYHRVLIHYYFDFDSVAKMRNYQFGFYDIFQFKYHLKYAGPQLSSRDSHLVFPN